MSTDNTWVCDRDQSVHERGDECELCKTEANKILANLSNMTAAERATAFETWISLDHLPFDFELMHVLLEKLLGRSIMSHEMGESKYRLLIQEAWGFISAPQYLDEIIAKLPPHLQDNVHTIDLSENDHRDFSEN